MKKPTLSAAAIMAKHNKRSGSENVDAEREFMDKSDDAKGGYNVEQFPWQDKTLSRIFVPKSEDGNLPQIGTRTNIRCPEWDYEVARWFAKQSPLAANTTHGVLMQAVAIGLEALIEKHMNGGEW
ncbi:MAG: hypothetical protein COA84_14245 [Robiginitomaculum sp.]|nr:MAG: hypothetical protein COA84_14245 [Robiginitomaculum sp.]